MKKRKKIVSMFLIFTLLFNVLIFNNSVQADIGREPITGSDVVIYASQFLGAPYAYGSTGPYKFDTTGFTQYVFAHFGITLGRTINDQMIAGTEVLQSDLQPGDLIFPSSASVGI